MANNWTELTDQQQDRVRERFIAMDGARQLAQALPAIAPATLYRYAKDKSTDATGNIEVALQTDDRLWSDFLDMLDLLDARHVTQLAAASSTGNLIGGWDDQRKWRYELKQSPEPPFEQVLIVDVEEGATAPTRLVATSQRLQQRADLQFDTPFRGTIQMILAAGDPLGAILSSNDANIRMW